MSLENPPSCAHFLTVEKKIHEVESIGNHRPVSINSLAQTLACSVLAGGGWAAWGGHTR